MDYPPLKVTKVAIPLEQYREVEALYSSNYHGDEYRGRNDFDKYLYERYLNNSRSIDEDCSQTLEKIKQENVPDGISKSKHSLMYWSNRAESDDRPRNEKGLFV